MRVSTLLSILLVLVCAGCASATPAAVLAPTSTPGVDEAGGVCSVDPQTTCAAPTGTAQPALYGTWTGQDGQRAATLTISADSVDLYMSDNAGADITEMRYEIQSIDWARDMVTMILVSQQVNGEDLPADNSLVYMKVRIDNATFYYSIGAEPPEKATSGPLTRE